MIVHLGNLSLPCKAILIDVLSRDGPPGPNDYPFDGMLTAKNNQINLDSYGDFSIAMQYLERDVSGKADFNYTINQAGMTREALNLLDVDRAVLERYVEQKLFAVTRYNDNSLQGYRRRYYRFQVTYTDDEGNTHTPTEMALEKVDNEESERENAKELIAYYVGMFDRESPKRLYHILGAIIAYKKARKEGRVNVRPSDLIKHGVHEVDKNGQIISRVADNFGAFPKFHKWITGGDPDGLYYMVTRFMNLIDYLDIDLTRDTYECFTPEYCQSIPTRYIMSNNELMRIMLVEHTHQIPPESIFKKLDEVQAGDIERLKGIGEQIVNNKITDMDKFEIVRDLYLSRAKKVLREEQMSIDNHTYSNVISDSDINGLTFCYYNKFGTFLHPPTDRHVAINGFIHLDGRGPLRIQTTPRSGVFVVLTTSKWLLLIPDSVADLQLKGIRLETYEKYLRGEIGDSLKWEILS